MSRVSFCEYDEEPWSFTVSSKYTKVSWRTKNLGLPYPINLGISYDIWGSHSGTDTDSSAPRCYNAPTGTHFPPLGKTVVPPSSAFSCITFFGRLDPEHKETTIPRNDESVWPLKIRNIWISNYCLSPRLLPLNFSLFPSDRYTHETSRVQSLLCKLLDYPHPLPPAVIKSAATSANHPERLINAYSHTRRNLSR